MRHWMWWTLNMNYYYLRIWACCWWIPLGITKCRFLSLTLQLSYENMKPEKDKCTWSYKNDEYKKMTRNKSITMDELWKWWQSSQMFEIKLFKIVSRVSEKWRQPTLPTCPLLLAVLLVEFPPLFHSVTGHSEYCWELSWDWELDCIAVSNELMVSSVEGIPKNKWT